MYFIILQKEDDIEIIDSYNVHTYAYNAMIDTAQKFINAEIGERRGRNAMVLNLDDIIDDGWYMASPNNTEITIYKRETAPGWLNTEVSIKPVQKYIIKEFRKHDEIAQAPSNVPAPSVSLKPVPTISDVSYIHLLDELKARLGKIRLHTRPHTDF